MEIVQSVTGQLIWIHYCEFLSLQVILQGSFMRKKLSIQIGLLGSLKVDVKKEAVLSSQIEGTIVTTQSFPKRMTMLL